MTSKSELSPDQSPNHSPNQSGAPSSYTQLRAEGLQRKNEDDFTQACFELGASGVSEDLKFVQKDLRYDPDVVETPHMDLVVYFTEENGLLGAEQRGRIVESLRARFPEARFELTSEENKDWLAEWKKGFKPFRFAGPFWVIPSWLTAPPEAPQDTSRHIYVEPGMAFGTGTHETTRLAAGLLISEIEKGKPQSLIDVGTGTGILALIAYRLGVQKLVGLDIDPEARRTARENLERNNATQITIAEYQIDNESAVYDVVVANIIDGVLLTLRHDLTRALKPGGKMVLSGILIDREAEFYREFTADTGLNLLTKTTEGEWSAAVLQKKA
jgi:ribosomal protein L11 methyltransferase